LKEYLIIDGYNIINNWEDLKREMDNSLDVARQKLLETMSDYQGYTGIKVIVVFDAHYVKNSMEKHEKYNSIEVVFTKEFESADGYIERLTALIAKDNIVKVATSDYLEQMLALGHGATRVSARELKIDIELMKKRMNSKFIEKTKAKHNSLEHLLDEKTRAILEKWRKEGL